MSNGEMLSTAMAVAKALQKPSEPLTVNGVDYDGSAPVCLEIGPLPIVQAEAEMTDKTRQYVLEATKTVWVNRYTVGHTNRMPASYTSPTDHSPYNGQGYKVGTRVSGSTGEYKDDGTASITGYVEVLPGQTVYMRNMVMDDGNAGNGSIVPFYTAEGAILSGKHLRYYASGSGGVQLLENGDYTFRVPETAEYEGVRFMRVQFSLNTPNPAAIIITVEEAIQDRETGYHWVDTGIPYGYDTAAMTRLEGRTATLENGEADTKKRLSDLESRDGTALPYWWEEHLPERIQTILSHRDLGGRDAFSFAVITDLHESESLGSRTGAVARRVMDACGIRYALELGDFSTQACVKTREAMETSMERARQILEPIADRLLRTRGNHDGSWGTDGAGGTYVHNFTEAEMYNRVFRVVADLHKPRFDTDGVGYYLDEPSARVRMVVLNTHHTGGNANNFSFHRYGQSQFDLIAEALTTVPAEDWAVLFFSHTPPVGGVDYDGDGSPEADLSVNLPEQGLLRELIEAYESRSPSFSGSYGSPADWDYVSLSGLDFSAAQGRCAAYFAGHLHGDCVFGTEEGYPIPVITVRSDAPKEKFAAEQAEPRIAGTASEHSFDVVTLIRTAEGFTLYLDKIGAGKDRIVTV